MKSIEECELLRSFFAYLVTVPTFANVDRIGPCSTGASGDTPLHIAAIRNDAAVALALVRAGAPINQRGEHGYTPLHEAMEQGSTEVAQLLLQHGADSTLRNDDGLTPAELSALFDGARN